VATKQNKKQKYSRIGFLRKRYGALNLPFDVTYRKKKKKKRKKRKEKRVQYRADD